MKPAPPRGSHRKSANLAAPHLLKHPAAADLQVDPPGWSWRTERPTCSPLAEQIDDSLELASGRCQTIFSRLDASQFNPHFPKVFPRFVQHAIWRYCAENGLDVCNGNQINDDKRCDNIYCRVYAGCDRVALRTNANS